MKYTAEEVRPMAKMVGDEFSPHAGSMLTAYAESMERAQSCEKCKGRGEVFNDVHVRMMTCPHCHGAGKVARDMLTAHADSLERAQGGVTDGVVDVAHDTIFGHPSFDIGENGFLGKPAVRAALLAVWPNPPAQAAQSVDIEAIREVIAHLRSFRSNTPPTWAHLDDAADKLEAAIRGEPS